jgi:WxL domain surface cell wall-binding
MSINAIFVLIVILALGGVVRAFATGCVGGCTANFTIDGSSPVSESDNGATINNGTPITLNGLNLQIPISMPITVTDARGTGAGWKLQISATQFETNEQTPVVLNNSYMKVSSVSASCAEESDCILPADTLTDANSGTDECSFASTYSSGFLLGTNTDGQDPPGQDNYTLCNAATNTGMGKIDLSPSISLFVPADVYSGTYETTITLTLNQTP